MSIENLSFAKIPVHPVRFPESHAAQGRLAHRHPSVPRACLALAAIAPTAMEVAIKRAAPRW